MTAATNASRKSAERQRRKDAGEVRVEVWLNELDIERLDNIAIVRGGDRQDAIKFALLAGVRNA